MPAKRRRHAAYDLLDNIKDGKVKLEELKKEQLPPEMQKMTLEGAKVPRKSWKSSAAAIPEKAWSWTRSAFDFINQEAGRGLKKPSP